MSAEADPVVGAVDNPKRKRVWGAVLLVLAALLIYTSVLGLATVHAGRQHGMVANSEVPFRIAAYAALTALCLWAGIKRHPRWPLVFGIALLVFGALCFLPRLSLREATTNIAIMKTATLITSVVLGAVGAVFTLIGLVRRKAA